jgi:hypothetical protein
MSLPDRLRNLLFEGPMVKILSEVHHRDADIVDVTYECPECGSRTVVLSESAYQEMKVDLENFCPHTP